MTARFYGVDTAGPVECLCQLEEQDDGTWEATFVFLINEPSHDLDQQA